MRNIHYPGRSVVMSTQGMIATSHPMATQVGLDILKQGGNALDAAVAANAVQCVTEPYSTGIGGDCFLLYHQASSDSLFALNGSGRAPQRATLEEFQQRKLTAIPERGILSVTVPGAVHAWQTAVDRFSSKDLGELLNPAILLAEQGYAISPIVGNVWRESESMLATQSFSAYNTEHPLLVKGAAPAIGSIHYQPQLARSLRAIASQGKAAFYTGELAEKMVNFSTAQNGLLELEDFAAHQSQWVEPISTTYRGLEVFEIPPNSAGMTALIMFNLLAQAELKNTEHLSAEHMHRMIEVFKLAATERDHFVSDPEFTHIPLQQLLSDDYAKQLNKRYNAQSVLPYPLQSSLPQHRDTAYITVVDRDGNAASFINSLYYPFGSGLVAGDTGIALQNRGCGFSLDQQHHNCIAPGKRPLHTILPAMAYQNGKLVLCYGVMGGSYQAMGHAYVLSNFLDFDMDIQQAIDAARFIPENGVVQVEQGVSQQTREALTKLGHQLAETETPLGGGQAIYINPETGVLQGGSDGRKDGCALGY